MKLPERLERLKDRLILIYIRVFLQQPEEKKVKEQPKISILFPYGKIDNERDKVFKWLIKYWQAELPDAEIVIGRSRGKPFCKTEAFNNAAAKATGKVLVLLDADTYMSGKVLNRVADRILEELDNGENLWYVPYRHLFRLNRRITKEITASDPANPLRLPSPPDLDDLFGNGDKSGYGHRYGAMVMVLPRQALDVLGCFDERFRGWGGEDIAILRALDTLWGKHKTTNNDVLHLWHPVIGDDYRSRMWKGQKSQMNSNLAIEYNRATRNPAMMRKLVDEGCASRGKKPKKEK